MSKLIFYADIGDQKIGDIVNGKIDDEGSIFICDQDYSDVEDSEYREFLENYYAIRYPYGYPVMRLEDLREQQIKSILDD